jgi:hypothetical protein
MNVQLHNVVSDIMGAQDEDNSGYLQERDSKSASYRHGRCHNSEEIIIKSRRALQRNFIQLKQAISYDHYQRQIEECTKTPKLPNVLKTKAMDNQLQN